MLVKAACFLIIVFFHSSTTKWYFLIWVKPGLFLLIFVFFNTMINLVHTLTINGKRWCARDSRMVSADESSELWWPPMGKLLFTYCKICKKNNYLHKNQSVDNTLELKCYRMVSKGRRIDWTMSAPK